MLAEKGGKFRLNFYNMRDGAGDGPTLPNKINKYDFSDPIVIEVSFFFFNFPLPNNQTVQKVKNRRPKDPLTPHQVAALTSVVTRHQPSTVPRPLLSPQQIQSSHTWMDDASSRPARVQRNTYRNNIATQHLNQYDRNSNPITPLLPHYQPNTKPIPILQRLYQAQQRQQLIHLFYRANWICFFLVH